MNKLAALLVVGVIVTEMLWGCAGTTRVDYSQLVLPTESRPGVVTCAKMVTGALPARQSMFICQHNPKDNITITPAGAGVSELPLALPSLPGFDPISLSSSLFSGIVTTITGVF